MDYSRAQKRTRIASKYTRPYSAYPLYHSDGTWLAVACSTENSFARKRRATQRTSAGLRTHAAPCRCRSRISHLALEMWQRRPSIELMAQWACVFFVSGVYGHNNYTCRLPAKQQQSIHPSIVREPSFSLCFTHFYLNSSISWTECDIVYEDLEHFACCWTHTNTSSNA